jgi:hypothetical protein
MIDAVRRRRAVIRDEVFGAYGGARCACCGEDEVTFLTIDHVRNDGKAHRRLIGSGGNAIHRWLKKNNFPRGFQVLCQNCNFGKYVHGVCPHKKRAKI